MDQVLSHRGVGGLAPSRWRTLIAILAVALLGGCTDPSVDPSESVVPTHMTDTLVRVAKTFYDCMTSAGLSVELVKNHDGELAVVQFSGDHWLMVRSPEGGTLRWSDASGSENDPESWRIAQAFFDEGTQPGLMIDGVDYSMPYMRCLERSGYNIEAAWGSSGMDFSTITKQVESNNTWAHCARSNGWPMIEDSIVPLDPEWSDWPAVLIPVTITKVQLRDLLGKCPNFDPERQEFINQWWHTDSSGKYPDDYLPDPSLDFYVPSLQDSEDPDADPTDEEKVALENVSDLYSILSEEAAKYWLSHINTGP